MLVCALSALVVRTMSASAQWITIAIWAAVYFFIMIAVHQLEARRDIAMTR
jgi:hypothetical protein